MCNGENLTGDVAGVAEASFDAVAVTTPANPIKVLLSQRNFLFHTSCIYIHN
jgi:hypothetical protein